MSQEKMRILQSEICVARQKLMDSKQRRHKLAEKLANADEGVTDAAAEEKLATLFEDSLVAEIEWLDSQMRLVEMGGTP